MYLREVRLRNFRSWRKLDFELKNQGLVFIMGKKGSGKSSIFDAISFALYRKTLKGIKADHVINWVEKKNCKVDLSFELDKKNCNISVGRGMKDHHGLEVIFDDEYMHFNTNTEAEKFLGKLLPFNFETFRNSIVFGQGVEKYFSGYADAEQKNIFESVIGLDIFDSALDKAKVYLAESTQRKLDVEFEIQGLEQEKENLKEQIGLIRKEIKESLREVKKNREALGIERDKRQKEVEDLKKVLKGHEDNISRLDSQFYSLLEEIEENEKVIKARKLRMVEVGEKSICPFCEREIDKLWKKAFLKKEKIKIDALIEKGDVKKIKKDNVDKYRLQVIAERDKALIAYDYLSSTLDGIIFEIALLDKADKIRKEQPRKQIEFFNDKIKEINKELMSKRKQLIKVQENKEIGDFAVSTFGRYGLRTLFIEKYLPSFNSTVNCYLNDLGEPNIKFEISENGRFTCVSDFERRTYQKLSGGERRCQDLAVGCALLDIAANRIGVKPNILILDEPFEGLDEKTTEKAVNLFLNMNIESIFVMSHNEALASFFPKIYKVVKEPNTPFGFSRLEK